MTAQNTSERNTSERNTWQAMRRGFMHKCPACGDGQLFQSYAKSVDECAQCKTEMHHHRADDMPAYLVMFFWGKIVITAFVTTAIVYDPPAWVHYALWGPLMLIGALVLLPSMKGAVIGAQWGLKMHGFDDEAAPEAEYDWP